MSHFIGQEICSLYIGRCTLDILQCTNIGTSPYGKGMEDDVEKEEYSSTRSQNQKCQST